MELKKISAPWYSDPYAHTHGPVLKAVALTGLVVIVYPNIVPLRVSLWDAAAKTGSQIFVLVGVSCVIPVVLAANVPAKP